MGRRLSAPTPHQMDTGMKITKVLNNSVVLAVDDSGRDVVLLGAGLGFTSSAGDFVDQTKVERVFVPEHPTSLERLATFVQEIPLADIELTEEIVRSASETLGIAVTDHLLVPLADHLSFALERARKGSVELDYPLRWEVQQLYPEEVRFARSALRIVKQRSGITLPDVEAVPLALHFVNAQLGASDITSAMRMTEVLSESLEIVGQGLGVTIDENSLPVARLVTHLRYLFLRQQRGQLNVGSGLPFDAEIRAALPREHELAVAVADRLSERWGTPLTDEETLYLTLHIGRLSAALRDSGETDSA